MPGTRPKLMHFACALINQQQIHPLSREANDNNKDMPLSTAIGYGLRDYLLTAYQRAPGNKPSRAAHYKRLAKKRANARARSAKK